MSKGNSGEFPVWGGLAVEILRRLLTNLGCWGLSVGIIAHRIKGAGQGGWAVCEIFDCLLCARDTMSGTWDAVVSSTDAGGTGNK